MTFFKRLDVQLTGDYRSPQETTQGKIKSIYSIDATLALDVLKGNATLTLNGKDLFNSRKRRNVVDEPGYYSESEFQWSSRQVILGFSYRLNQKKKKEPQRTGDEGGGGDDMGF
jgi:hypothetical protein